LLLEFIVLTNAGKDGVSLGCKRCAPQGYCQ
jgi:hypothetical protein